MSAVENERYKIPKYGFLNEKYTISRDLLRHDSHGSSGYHLVKPQYIGFSQIDSIPTKSSSWQVYHAVNYGVPNFPEGETPINALVALYKQDDRFRALGADQVILRISLEPINADEFKDDLAKFTKLYVERPQIWGFPFRVLGDYWSPVYAMFGGLAVGIAVGASTDFTEESRVFSAEIGALIGSVSGFFGDIGLRALAERRAQRQIPSLGQYMAGESATRTLDKIKQHVSKTHLQRELFDTLQSESLDLTPDELLKDIYEKLPNSLVAQREREVENARDFGSEHQERAEQARLTIVRAAQILNGMKIAAKQSNALLKEMDKLSPSYSRGH